MMQKFKSRKFLMALVSSFLVIANQGLGWDVDSDTIMAFAAIVIGYIAAEGYVDANRK